MHLTQGWRVAAILFVSLSVSSCGSVLDALPGATKGGGSRSELPASFQSSTISGVAQDGRVVNGDVRIYAFDGGKSDLLGSGRTDSDGRYSVAIQARSQPVLVEISGGQYKEETTATEVRMQDNQALRCVLLYESGRPSFAAVTYYSMLAAGLAENLIRNGAPPVDAVSEANRRISAILGIDNLAVVPAEVTNSAEARPTATSQLEYGFATAAISSLTEVASIGNNTVPHQVFNSIKFIQDAYDDVRADGVLDGNGTAGIVSVGTVALTPARYRHELALHILRTAGIESANKTGLSPKSLLRVAESLNNSVDPIFGTAAVVPLNSEIPAIFDVFVQGRELRSGAILFGTPTITASVMSLPGIQSIDVLVDDSLRGVARDPQSPLFELITSDIPDGLHELTLRATDIAGGVGSVTFDVLVKNKQTTIENISIDNGDYLRGQVQVTADINDPVGLTSVVYFVDEMMVASSVDPRQGVLLDVGTLADGSHVLRIDAINAAGSISSAEVQFFSDNASPEVSILMPSSGSLSPGPFLRGVFSLDAMVTDLAFESAEVFVGGNSQSTTAAPSFSIPIDARTFVDGENTIVVRAVDKAGNMGLSERRVVFDNMPPAVIFASPEPGSTVGGRREEIIEVKATVSDAISGLSSASIRIANEQGFERKFAIDASSGSIQRSIDSTSLAGDGPYEISIEAIDGAGNATNSTPVDVIVDNTAPSLNLASAAVEGVNRGRCVVSGMVADASGVDSVVFRVENTPNQNVDASLNVDRPIDLRDDGSFEFSIPVLENSAPRFTISLIVSAVDQQENDIVATRAIEFLSFERARFRNRTRESAGETTGFEPELECSFSGADS